MRHTNQETDGYRRIPSVVLASKSASRAQLLRAAGVSFIQKPAGVDETEVKVALLAEGATCREIADALAEIKAKQVSRQYGQAMVVGADQTLEHKGKLFDKPESPEQARAQLLALRGDRHVLHSAVAIAVDGGIIWRHVDQARLWVRPFSDAFLDAYLLGAGDEITGSVGGYRLESIGAQLFERVEGDYFTILGLPLLPLLASLRLHGVLET